MTTYNTRRKKGFRCLFALVTVTILAVPYRCFRCGSLLSVNSGQLQRLRASHRQPSFSHPFHRFGFLVGMDSMIRTSPLFSRVQPAPSTEPKPTENRIYVPPHWVDGGYGVQVLQPRLLDRSGSKRQSIDPFTRSHDVSSIRCNLRCPSRAADDDDLKDAAHGSYLAA